MTPSPNTDAYQDPSGSASTPSVAAATDSPVGPTAGPTTGPTAVPMVRFQIVSLFPEFFAPWQSLGVCGRAVSQSRVAVSHWNPRQFTHDTHQTVDDRPYGGGPGMVMMAEPLAGCIEAIRKASAPHAPGPVILFSPAGTPLSQSWIEAQRAWILQQSGKARTSPQGATPDSAAIAQFTLVCGRYEGVDQRFIDEYVDQEISLGDFVLSGGEIAALALMDALVRRLPGVLNDEMSSVAESFISPLLDHPHFTRPEVFAGRAVPSVLLSGHHGKIADWRKAQALELTLSRRPDLLKGSD
ncbi:MAG: tRNA (guanine(37)-N(1))-methyltransferase [Burkholderiaceae bacterium]